MAQSGLRDSILWRNKGHTAYQATTSVQAYLGHSDYVDHQARVLHMYDLANKSINKVKYFFQLKITENVYLC